MFPLKEPEPSGRFLSKLFWSVGVLEYWVTVGFHLTVFHPSIPPVLLGFKADELSLIRVIFFAVFAKKMKFFIDKPES